MENLIIKYASNTYEGKIKEFEGLSSRLNGHLATMEKYAGEVKNFWQEDGVEDVYNYLMTMCKQVRYALERLDEMKSVYTSTKQDLDNKGGLITGSAESALKAVEGLGI